MTRRSTRRATLRDESRRVVAALQARYADNDPVKGLKIRHNNVLGYFVEVTAQHGDKLMAPPLECDLHPPPDAGRPGPLHDGRARRARSQDRQRRRPRARAGAGDFRSACAQTVAAARTCKPRPHALGRARCRGRARDPRGRTTTTCGPRSTALDFAIEGGRHPVVEQALNRDGSRSSPTTATCRRGRGRSPADLADHRPQHGRQIDLPAPERPHRVLAQIGSFVPA